MRVLKGTGANPGKAVASVWKYIKANTVNEKRIIADPASEQERFMTALSEVKASLTGTAQVLRDQQNEKGAEIIEIQLMMLEDSNWAGEVQNLISSERVNAEYAVCLTAERIAETFKNHESQYLRERGNDILNIADAITAGLSGQNGQKVPDTPFIVFAAELSPEDIARMDITMLKGIVTEKGSPLSHMALLAGSLDIPCITGLEQGIDSICSGDTVVIDGREGTVALEPDESLRIEAEKEMTDRSAARRADISDEMIAKCPVKLYANIGSISDADRALKDGAQGIGLFRTELLYMDRDDMPDEEEQYGIYRAVLEKMQGRPVIIRTIDIGADKEARCVSIPKEANPALGTRGIRISFADPALFRTQLKALLRSAMHGDLRVMYPMITSAEEIDDIRKAVDAAADELKNEGREFRIPPQGIMIETPAAALISDELAGRVDFFSVGTNDLTQYTLALDRTSSTLGRYYKPHHPAIRELIRISAANAHRNGIPIGICGELGSDPDMLQEWLDMGIDEISMSSPKIRRTAAELRRIADGMKDDGRITAPADGKLIPMEQIPDEAFAQGLLGDCIGIDPDNGNIYAPCTGVITKVARTKHALGVRAADGREFIIHIGIDTVRLDGKGFTCTLRENDRIRRGEKIMEFDPDVIREAGLSPIVIIAKLP
ncbi:MAG: phosphoenolpyruvate--protein phosphotransferase [Clostridiales bacterium]|nr:phosphoenolpyruvate--protein phosphotransferase [Clostridiales bacterium]